MFGRSKRVFALKMESASGEMLNVGVAVSSEDDARLFMEICESMGRCGDYSSVVPCRSLKDALRYTIKESTDSLNRILNSSASEGIKEIYKARTNSKVGVVSKMLERVTSGDYFGVAEYIKESEGR